jgi:glutamate synthase (NADPH/NADH) small chain
VEKPGSLFRIDTDTAIVAIGTSPNPLLRRATEGLHVNRHGAIIVDPANGMTSIPGVFAGGDIVSGDSTVILAMGAGKQAAAGIDAYIRGKAADAG